MMTQFNDHIKDFLSNHHWVIFVIIFIGVVDGILKLIAMWKAARNNEVV